MEFNVALRRLFSGRRPAVRLLERLQPPPGAREADRLSPSPLPFDSPLSTPSVSPNRAFCLRLSLR